jgi:hypothetical protein
VALQHSAQMMELTMAAASSQALAGERLRQATLLAQHNAQQQALHSSYTLHSMSAAGAAQAPAAAAAYLTGINQMYHDPAGPWRPPVPQIHPPQRPPSHHRRRDRRFRSRSRSPVRGRLGRPAAPPGDYFGFEPFR